MGIDLLILSIVAVAAAIGASSGFSRQVAQILAVVVAVGTARPLGTFFGPRMAAELQAPLSSGVIAATIVAFIIIVVACRYAFTALLQRMMAGKDPYRRPLDRSLGAVMAAVKVLGIAYVMISALTFVEDNVTIAGRKLGLSPKSSLAFSFARKYNMFEYSQFRPVKDLVEVARAASDPERARKLQADPAFQALRKDPRFQKALSDAAMKKAIETGDYRTLLRSNPVLQLIQDPIATSRLDAALRAAD